MKSIFASKTAWINVLGLILTYGGYLPEKYAAPVMTVANIALRFLTSRPVSLTGK